MGVAGLRSRHRQRETTHRKKQQQQTNKLWSWPRDELNVEFQDFAEISWNWAVQAKSSRTPSSCFLCVWMWHETSETRSGVDLSQRLGPLSLQNFFSSSSCFCHVHPHQVRLTAYFFKLHVHEPMMWPVLLPWRPAEHQWGQQKYKIKIKPVQEFKVQIYVCCLN